MANEFKVKNGLLVEGAISGSSGIFSGNVGIGTNSPSRKLEVYASSGDALIMFNRAGSYGWDIGIGGGSSLPTSYFGIYDASYAIARLVIAPTTGNVGIGTTTPAYKFTVKQSANGTAGIASLNSSGAYIHSLDSDGSGNGTLNVYDATSSQKISFNSVGASFFNGGNVGIGTPTPGEKLDVNGNIKLNNELLLSNPNNIDTLKIYGDTSYIGHITHNQPLGSSFGGSGMIVFDSGEDGLAADSAAIQKFVRIVPGIKQTSTAGFTVFEIDTSETTVGTGTKLLMNVKRAGVSKFVIDGTGNVGIGTEAPSGNLSVSGATGGSSYISSKIVNTNTSKGTVFIMGETEDTITPFYIERWGSTHASQANRATIYNNGLLRLDTSANNNIALMPGGTGNVGIGTVSPESPIHIYTNTAGQKTGLILQNYNNADGNEISLDFLNNPSSAVTGRISNHRTSSSQFNLIFSVWQGGLSEKMRILYNGNVGIGTTNPSASLHVSGSGLFYKNVDFNGISVGESDLLSAGITWRNALHRLDIACVDHSFPIAIGRTGAGHGGIFIDTTTNGSRVGIGTEAPTRKFEVSDANNIGTVTFMVGAGPDNYGTGYGPVITTNSDAIIFPHTNWLGDSSAYFGSDGTYGAKLYGDHGTTLMYADLTPGHVGAFPAIYINSYYKKTGTTYGDIGIQTTTPNGKLDIQGFTNAYSGLATGVKIGTILSASANSDVLTGLYVNPTFSNGAYSGVKNFSAVFLNGNVGIGTSVPLTKLQVGLDNAAEPVNMGSLYPQVSIFGAQNNTSADSVLRLIRPTYSGNSYPASVDFRMSCYGTLVTPYLPKTQLTIGLKATGNYVVDEVVNVLTLRDNGSVSHGTSTDASGSYSHAEGSLSTSKGASSHAEGEYTITFGGASHAEGYASTAIGAYSHAEGYNTTSVGNYSHSEGNTSKAVGTHSHAEGNSTTAVGNYSHTEGASSIARNSYEQAYSVNSGGQFSRYGLFTPTNSSSPVEMYITGTEEISIPLNSTSYIKVDIAVRGSSGSNVYAIYQIICVANVDSTFATANLVVNTNTAIYDPIAVWSYVASISTSTGKFRVSVTGDDDNDLNWYATVEINSVYKV